MDTDFEIQGAGDPHSRRIDARLGVIADAGYQPLPNVLLMHQKDLGITSEDLNVLLNVMMHRHTAAVLPFPHSITIAKRMGVSSRTVQRRLASLRKRGLILKVRGQRRDDPAAYDIRPLLKKLEPYAIKRIALVGERSFDELPPRELEALL